ncbi:putative nucleic acid-binding protein [Chryseobacterium sp. 7]|uniref:hypothetical protein n=1 Tax=Chryseobacterium sp. 7 TaxID=2035214 RepID=UPI000EB3E40C|nr:hypothetical protein [Chryseobacterium sp. 7]RLJ31170.1 putative nucleic acid-binding protein [Chryseobacterium sp. 7]
MAKKKDKIILIDADVVSHFIKASEIYFLCSIFDYDIKVLDKVYAELERFPKKKIEIDNLINQKILEIEKFPEENQEIVKEYFYIKNKLFKGDGESACLAVARYTENIVASSNLKDIRQYCNLHNVEYLATMDFLCEAYRKGIFDLERCNKFITNVLAENGRLPVKKMEDYTCKQFNFK